MKLREPLRTPNGDAAGAEPNLFPRTFCSRQSFPFWRFLIADRPSDSLFNPQLALAGWTLSLRRDDYGVHGRVDDIRLADWAGERMVVKVQFDRAHGRKS